MEFKELLDIYQLKAIADKLEPTENSVFDSMCRVYSEKFHTPLHIVVELDPEFILKHYYSVQMDKVDVEEKIEQLLDVIYSIEDPNYENEKKVELDDFMEQAEEEEKERIKSGKPIHRSMKNEPTLKNSPSENEVNNPVGGFLDLSYLDNADNER